MVDTINVLIDGKDYSNVVSSFEYSQSYKEIERKGLLRIANAITIAKNKYRVGDRVEVRVGQNVNYAKSVANQWLEYVGYITSISATIPIEIELSDAYKIKNSGRITKSYSSITLVNMLKDVFGDNIVLSESIPVMILTNFILDKATSIQLLQKIKDYGLVCYFRDEKLYVGLAYSEQNLPTLEYSFQRNILKDHSLIFKSLDRDMVKITGHLFKQGGKVEKVEVGDDEGINLDFYYYDESSISEVKKIIQNKLDTLKYEGYEGDLKTFGFPYIEHSYGVKIIDDRYPFREGTFIAESIKTVFNNSEGFKRTITVGKRLS